MLKRILYENNLVALVVKNNYSNDGIKFFTDDSSSFQMGYMSHSADTVIKAHVHNIVERKVVGTPEVLIIKKGKLRLDLYTQEKEYIESTILEKGDIVFLSYGGHGLKCLEDVDMIEVKQGPYLGVDDKVRFKEIEEEKVIIND